MTKRRTTKAVPAIALKGERALCSAVAEVVEEHRREGKPLAVWHKGKAVLLTPEKAMASVRENRALYSTTVKRIENG